jgi:hypothetical protein
VGSGAWVPKVQAKVQRDFSATGICVLSAAACDFPPAVRGHRLEFFSGRSCRARAR